MANTIGTAYVNIAPNMSGIQGKIAGGLRGSGQQFAQQFGTEISGKSALVIGAIAGVAQAGVTKAMSLVTNSISSAIRRVDTLNAAQKTFQYMGFAADDAAAATKAVTKSILGLPTPLDSAIRGMTSLAATYQNVKLGQRVFSALNDAILGFGGSAAEVDNAIQQLSQLPLDGPLDAQTWNSLRNSGLTPVLVAIGKDMGKSVSQLKSDFGDGTLKVQDFVNELTKLDTKGGGGLVSLQKIAHNATSGIGTGFQNMQTAISRGLANIIQAVGQKNISNAITKIGSIFEKALNSIAVAIPKVVNGIKSFFEYVNRNKDIFYPIAVAIGSIVAAITAWKIALGLWSAATKIATAVQAGFNAVMAINPVTAIALAILGLVTGLTYFFTKTETGKKVWGEITVFISNSIATLKSVIGSIGDFAGAVWDKVKGGVDGLVGAVQAVIRWFYAWRAWFINIGIVIGTILLPSLIKIGIQATIAAAKAVASFVLMAAGAVKNAAITSAAWVVSAAKSAAAFVIALPGMIAQFALASAAAVVNAAKSTAAWVAGAAQTLAAWAVTLASYLAGIAVAAAQTLLAGARMAAAWLLALGPIGLIVAVVAGAVALIIANWNKLGPFFTNLWNGIKNIIAGVINWVRANWPLVLAIITGPIGLAVLYVIRHFQQIKDGAAAMISGLVSFFGGLPGRILRAIGNLGSLLYNSGRDLISGLLHGAGSLLSSIGQFFLDKLPGWIRGPFKRALGIHSPSTVFAGYGENLVQGLVGGLNDGQSMVKNAMGNLSDAAAGNFNVSGSADMAAGGARAGGRPVVVHLHMDGVMARSRSDLRYIAKDMLGAVNEELVAKGAVPIGGGAI